MSYSQIWCIEFFEEIKVTLEHAESVKMSGFGKFELRDKVARLPTGIRKPAKGYR